ncbi:MAG: class I SAM-dependent methyltransferase [Desulfobacterium sp.]|nr:class I SAM-dependent methyltransferase [Desulfobacterium sp.]
MKEFFKDIFGFLQHGTDKKLHRDHLSHYPKSNDSYEKWSFPTYLDNDKCKWLKALKELYEMPISFPASLSPEAGLLVHGLIRNLRPRVIAEVGVFCSVSTHWIASALKENEYRPKKDAIIHCYDDFSPIKQGPYRKTSMDEGRFEFVKSRLEKAGLIDYIEFHKGDSSTNIYNSHDHLKENGGVDFAFIDGDHSIDGFLKDFEAIEPVLNTGGYLLLHDTFPEQCGGHEGPRYLIDNVNKIGRGYYEQIELHLSPINFGMALQRRIG